MHPALARLLLLLCCLLTGPALAGAPRIGELDFADCAGPDGDAQSFWSRVAGEGQAPPAGCVLGTTGSKALLLLDGARVELQWQAADADRSLWLRSDDGKVEVELQVTATESSCVPGEDKCCGEWTRAQLVLIRPQGVAPVSVENYQGG